MDNKNKIGCRFGSGSKGDRTKIIDPNLFGNETNSSRNIPVNLDDLTISVKLTTRKKGRTVLSTDNSENNSSVKEQKDVKINFIDGTDINGKNVLTTKYTQLTTVFDKDTFNPETFGITNIDIDFNSSYVPMIKINFIDVKGSSIFQNEEEILDNNTSNKYAVFFEFPYPLFELEIKGYYGQPVTYCLHLLKFNTKFNPDSGNFEIACEFMGYTYALLADMLVGFLRVIPFTKIGEEKFDLYNEGKGEDEKILNLVDLKDKIDRISDAIQKTAKKSEEAKLSNTFTEAISILNQLEINFNNLQNFSKDDGAFTRNIVYNFVIMNDTSFTPEQNEIYNVTKEAITENITKFNNLNIEGVTLDVTKVKIPIKLTNLTKNKLLPEFNLVFSSVSDIESFKSDLLNFLDKTFAVELNPESPFSVFDLREIYKIINEQKQKLDEELKNSKKNLAERIKENVIENLGFDPTVRNMVEVFTSLIEVFIETIYEVSVKAESEIKRKELFKLVFNNNEAGDYNKEDIDTFNYYPWPSYRERKNANEGFVDKYLGDNDIIKNNISDVPELVFIENLLNAFLLAKRREDTLAETNPETAVAYIPISPLDTKLFDSNGNPYSRIELINPQQIYRLALIRAMIFMGYTNDENFLTQEEILKISELEAMSLLDGLKNPKLKVAISNITKNDIINSIGKINFNDSEKIIKKVGNDYVYDYLYKDSNIKLLPLNSDLTQKRVPSATSALALKEFQEDGNLFLTNYSSGIHKSFKVSKFDDGGIYVKFFTKNEFEEDIIPLIETVATDNLINLPALKATDLNPQTIGFNSFAGSYGIQEFVNLDTGDENIKTIPLKYIFYSTTSNFEYSITRTINSNIEKGFDIKSAKDYDKYKYGKNKRIYRINYETNLFKYKTLLHGNNLTLYRLINEDRSKLTYPYIEYRAITIASGAPQEPFSLFGSSWYYLQEDAKITRLTEPPVSAENYVKGLLFLNTIPFNNDRDVNNYSDPFDKKEITRLFNIKGGFIHVPRLWAAYIGGLLWWLSDDEPDIVNGLIVGGGRGQKDPVVWKWACDKPMDNDYIPKTSSPTPYSDRQLFPKALDTSRTKKVVESVIDGLPEQVRDEFKKVFFDFINNTEDDLLNFNFLKENLEIKKGTNQNFCTFLKRLKPNDSNTLVKKDANNKTFYDTSDFDIYLKNLDNYSVIAPIGEYKTNPARDVEWLDWSVFLELKDNTEVTNRLVNSLLDEELIIANTGYAIWDLPNRENKPPTLSAFNFLRKDIKVNENNFDLYFDNFVGIINDSLAGSTLQNEEEKELNSIFGMSNKSDIKLMLYRHCKNIYDKWLGGVTDPSNVIFQCGDNTREGSNRNTIDLELAKKYNRTKPRLIDSFRFVTRSFRDIGDELFVNPKPINDSLTNSNVSAYSVISVLLNDNKFNFIPLPTFINYRDEETLQNVFNPIQYSETVGSCGPTFVCVYVGQSSNSLDIKSGKYPNDGFDFRCDSPSSMPSDFNSELREGEDPVSVFSVNYSQQNQNIFKSISLDQSEYSETEESLKIVEDISMQGFENKPTPGGQNLYNVYAVRSYNAEVEMLGNAMIQPMMYFQLNNIPMFHGAYMITRVKHNIKPNHMSTTFTGVRIRAVESPIIDIADAYMNLIDTLDLSEAGTSTRASVNNSNGNAIIGANCGEFKLAKPITDGAEGFYNSKPIRDLIANFESAGNYNAYNNGIAGQRGSIVYKPIEMTISEIRAVQALPTTDPNRIFAVGKYQLVNSPKPNGPKTFDTMVSALGFSDNTIFNAENQEKAGEWLIFQRRSGLKDYFATGSKGTEIQLQKAITDLGLEFASFPLYHMGFINNNRSGKGVYEDAIGYNSKQAAYGGSAGNPAQSKICAQDVAKALIETWKRRNNNKEPEFTYEKVVSSTNVSTNNNSDSTQKLTANDKSVAVIIGDSTVGVFNSVPNGLSKNKIDISFNKEGERVPWLVEKLKSFSSDGKKYGNTKHVFVSIGTNDGYIVNDASKKKISELNDLIKKVYPNAKRVVVPGTYGWGTVINSKKENQDAYYKMFTDLGFVYEYPNANALLQDVGKAHNPKEQWFIKSVEKIVSIKNS